MRILLIALVVSVLISLAAGGLEGLSEVFGSGIVGPLGRFVEFSR